MVESTTRLSSIGASPALALREHQRLVLAREFLSAEKYASLWNRGSKEKHSLGAAGHETAAGEMK